MKHVAIVGGGVIGLCSAYSLVRRGCRVTVIDASTPGMACSRGNAGWVSPSFSAPIPAPGLIKTSLKWMLRSDSPLFIKPRFDLDFVRWLIGFWSSCTLEKYENGLNAVSALSAPTMALFDELRAQGVQFEMHTEGLILAYLSWDKVLHDQADMEKLQPFGYELKPLSGDELRKLEPSLSDAVAGGYWISQERQVRPESLTAGLIAYLQEHGVAIMSDAPVQNIERQDGRATALVTSKGRIEADDVLVCAGAWTPQILKKVGVSLPVEGGKGYSMDFDSGKVEGQAAPRHSIYMREAKVAASPFEGTFRLGGTMELSGLNHKIAPRRIEAMLRAADAYLRHPPATPGDTLTAIKNGAWAGLRPLTPDGLPILGLIPGFSNLSVATGHAMLGITLGPATGEVMAELIATGETPPVIRPFEPARFMKGAR